MADRLPGIRHSGPNAKILGAALAILVVAVVAVAAWGISTAEDIGPNPRDESGAAAPPPPENTAPAGSPQGTRSP